MFQRRLSHVRGRQIVRLGRVLFLLIAFMALAAAPVRAAMIDHAHMATQVPVSLSHDLDHGHAAPLSEMTEQCSDEAGQDNTEKSHASKGSYCLAWCAVAALPAVFSSLSTPEPHKTREPLENTTGPTGTLSPPIRPPRA